MARDWETTFRAWTAPSSNTEQQKQDSAEGIAIKAHPGLARRSITVFPQGSYRNNTNVRQDSDVDICVRCDDTFFYNVSAVGGNPEQVGISPATYTYPDFKAEVEAALVAKFGRREVTRGTKAFDIKANSYRVDADVVACFEHRRYYEDRYGNPQYHSGTEFYSDKGEDIINWPQQHYESGIEKNKSTGLRFKSLTRVIKRLRNEMKDNGYPAAEPLPSFFIECLVYNVPDNYFGNALYSDDVRNILAHIFKCTATDEGCENWVEVSGFKWLFRSGQNWKREYAFAFAAAAWQYIGL